MHATRRIQFVWRDPFPHRDGRTGYGIRALRPVVTGRLENDPHGTIQLSVADFAYLLSLIPPQTKETTRK